MADEDMELDHLFARARQERPALPDDLAVRIQTDAEAARLKRLDPKVRPTRWFWRLFANVGGWQGFGGLVAASAAGIWIGFSAPTFLPDPANLLVSQDTTYLMADLGYDTTFLESTE
ncbi:hypothetical protein HW561_02600 [Rhodobacteraceae bacterium B1Z28]|uniref:Dihydroorotate dehydrogenase n=1 Tax=Ruegeria haliotis TaxID=2747601 RepID=A0ABX2PNL2_9RHOB|nr:hypothetical protein [Ruegeria haliotis]NVO54679.1 hypothetical protein [Ruegeria haliotis]